MFTLRSHDYILLPSVKRYPRLCAILFDLIVSACPERVGAHQAGLPVFLQVVEGELGAGGRLAGALQANEHDDVRFPLDRLVGLDAGIDELKHESNQPHPFVRTGTY